MAFRQGEGDDGGAAGQGREPKALRKAVRARATTKPQIAVARGSSSTNTTTAP